MKCEKCGNIIDSDDLVCHFCSAESQSPEADIEVLNEVEENPSIVFSENISIEDLSVAKPKKKRKKKKNKKSEEDNEEVNDDIKEEKSSKKEMNKEKNDSSDKEDKKKSHSKTEKDNKKSSKKDKSKEENKDSKKTKDTASKDKNDSTDEKQEESISNVLESIYEERDLKSKITTKEESTNDDQEELSEEDNPELENTFVAMKEVTTDKINIDPSEEEYGEKIFDIEDDPEALVEESGGEEKVDKTIFEEIKEETNISEDNTSEEKKEEPTVLEDNISKEEKEESTALEDSTPGEVNEEKVDKEEDNSKESNEDDKNASEEVINKEVTDNTVYDIPKIISSEEYVLENTQEPEDAYEPFVKSDNIVPLPPKKTILYRIKDFYSSLFEGYEKAEEIKVDDREARLTLDKIYDANSKKLREKRIHINEVVMVWLMCFVFSFFSFFVFTCISFIIDIAFGSHNNIPLLMYIIPFFQIGVPLILTCGGWVIGIIYSFIKHSKKSNR